VTQVEREARLGQRRRGMQHVTPGEVVGDEARRGEGRLELNRLRVSGELLCGLAARKREAAAAAGDGVVRDLEGRARSAQRGVGAARDDGIHGLGLEHELECQLVETLRDDLELDPLEPAAKRRGDPALDHGAFEAGLGLDQHALHAQAGEGHRDRERETVVRANPQHPGLALGRPVRDAANPIEAGVRGDQWRNSSGKQPSPSAASTKRTS
jgi:hypothetical protein